MYCNRNTGYTHRDHPDCVCEGEGERGGEGGERGGRREGGEGGERVWVSEVGVKQVKGVTDQLLTILDRLV